MPAILKFYLGEEPILKNVPTWCCREPDDLAYVLDHSKKIVEHPKVQYVVFPDELYTLARQRMDSRKTGTVMLGVHGASNLVEIYRQNQ